MTDLILLDIRFQDPRDSDSGRHVTWERLLASVSRDLDRDAGDDV